MISKLKIAFAAALIAAVTVPMFSATSQAAPTYGYDYTFVKHGTNGW